MTNDQPVNERLTTVPMLASIIGTAVVMALVIVWQMTGMPIVALLLVPWLAIMVALIVPALGSAETAIETPSPVRRRAVVAGIASVALVATVAAASGWTPADRSAQAADRPSTAPTATETAGEIAAIASNPLDR